MSVFGLRKLQKISCFILSLFCFLFVTSQNVLAQSGSENFEIKLHSTYTVTATGKALVEQKFTIKNKTPELFVSKYGIVVSSTNLESIEITHNGKNLEPSVAKQKGQTSIGVTFEDKVVGEGKTNELIISYTDKDIALISGKILEINIPELADHDQYQAYQLELRVPSIFDTPSRINPNNFSLRQDGDYNVITYSNLKNESVSAIFGNKQVFELKLNYYLNNPTSQNALTQITLPPETPYQRVHYFNLDPMPKNIKEDADGNFIATYEIPANNSFNVELLAQVLLTLSADPLIPFSPILADHLHEQKFWEVGQNVIIELAKNLSGPRDISSFIVEKLDYTQQSLEQDFARLGALGAIKEENLNNATCQEFTDLFVTLARQNKIPARRVVGIAYSNNEELRPSNLNSDILHTWPEYYDKEQQAWLRTDPTWEDTTGGIDYFNNFDLNHIALAINGVSSSLPYSAGSYSGDTNEKNKKIYLDISKENFYTVNPDFEVDLISKKIYGLNIPGNYELQILNKTGMAWYFKEIRIGGENVDININQDQEIQRILPFAKIVLPITVYNRDGNLQYQTKIQVATILKEGQVTNHEFEVTTRFQFKIANPQKAIFVGGSFIVFTLLTGSLFFLGRKFANSLRRQGQKLEEKDHQLQAISTALKENQENDGVSSEGGISSPRK